MAEAGRPRLTLREIGDGLLEHDCFLSALELYQEGLEKGKARLKHARI